MEYNDFKELSEWQKADKLRTFESIIAGQCVELNEMRVIKEYNRKERKIAEDRVTELLKFQERTMLIAKAINHMLSEMWDIIPEEWQTEVAYSQSKLTQIVDNNLNYD